MEIFSITDIGSINDEGLGLRDNKKTKYGGIAKKLNKKTIVKNSNIKKKIVKKTKSDSDSSDIDEQHNNQSHIESSDEDVNDKSEKMIDLSKKQEELKISEILSNPITELSQEELKTKIDEYYNKYCTFVDIVNEYYPKTRIPLYIKEETNIELKLLHILNELRKISSFLNTPIVLDDYNKTIDIKQRNKELFTRKPNLDKSVYIQTINNLGLLDLNELKRLVNKYNYNDLFKVMKFKFSRSTFIVESDQDLYCKRYWVNNMEQYKNLVYDKSVYYKKINKKTGINPVYLDLTDTILYKNEEKIKNDLKRFVSNTNPIIDNKTLIDKIDNNLLSDNRSINNKIKVNQVNINKQQHDESCFISSYNKYIEDKIKLKMVKCSTVSVRTMINISDQLINSININNLMNRVTQNSELIDIILSDVRIFLVDVLYNMNSSIKNKRELYFANAKIIFDISKNIKSSLKTELYTQDIKFPLDTFEKKTEAYGKLKSTITKVINESGVKTIGRSADQTICI